MTHFIMIIFLSGAVHTQVFENQLACETARTYVVKHGAEAKCFPSRQLFTKEQIKEIQNEQ